MLVQKVIGKKVVEASIACERNEDFSAGILEQSVGARIRNRVGKGLSYRPARLHRLADRYDNLVPSPHELF